ncbi:hypothetical protein P9250_32125 [Caballeronia sp. LP006]|uniref:hypothetical protein n=1 Tax=Caballeronia sp. LP006 TaxID=3038552 RepID=UPI002862E9BF|nr:hypothetical protein [Caballeronia sp. LP006]MDR5832498.1 hypothetical protein [Caballeronia sp. LP006]
MKTHVSFKQAARGARFVDALLLARYALTIHDGITVLGDDDDKSHWPMDFSIKLRRIDEVFQMAGINTTLLLHPPQSRPRQSFPRSDVDDPPMPSDRGES